MPSSEQNSELTRRTKQRLASVALLRIEHDLITAQSARRLVESRALLEQSAARTARWAATRGTAPV